MVRLSVLCSIQLQCVCQLEDFLHSANFIFKKIFLKIQLMWGWFNECTGQQSTQTRSAMHTAQYDHIIHWLATATYVQGWLLNSVVIWSAYITVCMAQPVHLLSHPYIHQLDLFLQIFLWRLFLIAIHTLYSSIDCSKINPTHASMAIIIQLLHGRQHAQ